VLPVAHGEGRLVAASPAVIAALERAGQVALRYRDNYNGSEGAIAGVCDRTGRVFGLMPHPDRFLDWTRHPSWTRLSAPRRATTPPGLRMFQNAVEAASRVAAV
jgi:phosphoribosylformylglycinamidine synthase